jgi:hypothetical protein
MSWRPRRAQSLLDPAWRLLGVALVVPAAGQVASGNLLFLGDLDTGRGYAWIAYQLLVLAGLVVGTRIVLDGRWRGATIALALAWVGMHVAYDLVLTDSFVRFGERVVIPRPWAFGEAMGIGAWLAGALVVGGGLAARGALERTRAGTRARTRVRARGRVSRPVARRLVLVGLAAMLRGR